jgi:hypothetical protein
MGKRGKNQGDRTYLLELLHLRVFYPLYQVRVVAALSELHLYVHELGQEAPHPCLVIEESMVPEGGRRRGRTR